MWLATRNGFYSITKVSKDDPRLPKLLRNRPDGDVLQVRSRDEDQLKAFLFANSIAGAKVIQSENSDYPFRVFLLKGVVSEILLQEVGRIDYDNFKNAASAATRGKSYGVTFTNFLHRVWDAGLWMQIVPSLYTKGRGK
jgi:hypothetical protein